MVPYFLYVDDFEVINPLGSHSSSILGIYYSFPSAPEVLRSDLNNIFVAALFKSKDIKDIGHDKCFNHLVEEINELQSIGIHLTLNQKQFKIKFVLGLIIEDNLGVNTVLGFARSFSSNYFCRFCISEKREMQTFVHYFPLLIGDLIPENDQIWLFFINFVEMIDLLLLSKFNDQVILNLQNHITYHNNKYVSYYVSNIISRFIETKTSCSDPLL